MRSALAGGSLAFDQLVPAALDVEHHRLQRCARARGPPRAAPRGGPRSRRCPASACPARSASRRAGSMVHTSVLRPIAAARSASAAETVVLPTPPAPTQTSTRSPPERLAEGGRGAHAASSSRTSVLPSCSTSPRASSGTLRRGRCTERKPHPPPAAAPPRWCGPRPPRSRPPAPSVPAVQPAPGGPAHRSAAGHGLVQHHRAQREAETRPQRLVQLHRLAAPAAPRGGSPAPPRSPPGRPAAPASSAPRRPSAPGARW